MVTMKPVKEREILEQLNEQENKNANFAYALYDQNQVTGYLLYNLHEKYGEFVAIQAQTLAEKDGLIRAVMANIYDLGVDQVIVKSGFPIEVLRELNMLKEHEYTIASIEDILFQDCASKRK